MRLRTTLVTCLSIVSLAACGGEPPKDPSAMTASSPPPAASPTPMPESRPAVSDARPVENNLGGQSSQTAPTEPPPAPAKALSDAEITGVTSAANTGEIEMAELAKKNATNADVKSFAAMMITHHREAETKGKTVATKAKISPSESEASSHLKNDVSSAIDALKNQKGKDFDRAYIESQVKAHKDVLDIIDNKLLPAAQNADLKNHLGDVRKSVAMHLAKAEEIQQKLDKQSTSAPPTTPKQDSTKAAAPKK
ncbi:MAG: DUF4142 domain-containing protein [Deltaproteobacteria bacterium]|nr:DUF4142 domain-containing protein [Deltaproteobacteria bacterium]